jgi:hypothetical protein
LLVVSTVEVQKRLLCKTCHGRLGSYRAAFTPDGVILGRVHIPVAVKVWKTERVDWERHVSALKLLEVRYHWDCPCGKGKPVWRASKLGEKWSQTDGIEYV